MLVCNEITVYLCRLQCPCRISDLFRLFDRGFTLRDPDREGGRGQGAEGDRCRTPGEPPSYELWSRQTGVRPTEDGPDKDTHSVRGVERGRDGSGRGDVREIGKRLRT